MEPDRKITIHKLGDTSLGFRVRLDADHSFRMTNVAAALRGVGAEA